MKKRSKLTTNFLYQITYQILSMILPLITTPYLARKLGAECTGIYSYSYVIVNYFCVFASLGIETYGNRLTAKTKEEGQDKLNYAFSSLLYMHIIISCLSIFAYAFYLEFFVKEYRLLAIIQSFALLGSLFDVNWFFFGIEEFKLTVQRNMAVRIISIALIFIFVKNSGDLWKYTLIMALSTLISQVVVWYFIPRYVKIVKVKRKDVFQHFKPLCVLFVAVVATSIYRMIDKLMIGAFCTMGELGAYEYADRLIRLAVTVITALGTVMLPRMTSLYAQKKDVLARKYMNTTSELMFTMSFALAFGLAGIAKEFISWFLGDGYEQTVVFVIILAFSIPFMGWNNLIRTQVLIPKEKDTVYTRAVWAGAIVNIVLNYALISAIGTIGAAFATVISYFIVSLFQTIPVWKEMDIFHLLKYLIIPFISGVIMFICVRLVGTAMKSSFTAVITEICVGAIVYICINLVYLIKTKNEIVLTYLNSFKARLK